MICALPITACGGATDCPTDAVRLTFGVAAQVTDVEYCGRILEGSAKVNEELFSPTAPIDAVTDRF